MRTVESTDGFASSVPVFGDAPVSQIDMGQNMVKYMTMIRINIADVKTNLSRYLERVERGETIILCRRNVPIAELRPIAKLPDQPRPVGIDRGMTIPASFFEPLPDDLLDAFEGRRESK